MKSVSILLAIFSLSFQVNAYENTFDCPAGKLKLWGQIESVGYSYNSLTQVSTISIVEEGGKKALLKGTFDSSFKSTKNPDTFRLINLATKTSRFPELTPEAYFCEIKGSNSLIALGSKGGLVTLTCRGESFEIGTYNCR